VQHVLAAAGAELLPFDPLGVHATVLVREIVPILTIGAFQDDLFSWHMAPGYWLWAIGYGMIVYRLLSNSQ
jgi:hypothetical protein